MTSELQWRDRARRCYKATLSGDLTVKGWCAEMGIDKKLVHRWMTRLKKEGRL